MPSGGPGGGLYYESNGAGAKPSAEPKARADGPPHRTTTGRHTRPGPAATPDPDRPPHPTRTGRRTGRGQDRRTDEPAPDRTAVPDEPDAGGTAVPDEGPAVPAPWHTGPMLQHATFVFTYGIRPAGCHGRAA
ncbi:hypothetical protein GCM10023100_31030 [Actinocorallia cavernae]|uniref:Uncharacterized protein n=2 Tax=Actinomycetes TaxID=1760 RepID=A0ABP5YM67_9ACTN